VAKRYLRSIPKDPFTQSAPSWVAVPPADPKKGGVFDVHSAAKDMSAGSKAQRGFTYMAFLLFVASLGRGLAAYGELASHAAQREKEAELLFRGEQYRDAIASYYKKEQRYPAKLADLVETSATRCRCTTCAGSTRIRSPAATSGWSKRRAGSDGRVQPLRGRTGQDRQLLDEKSGVQREAEV
jgi:hypothetical protein